MLEKAYFLWLRDTIVCDEASVSDCQRIRFLCVILHALIEQQIRDTHGGDMHVEIWKEPIELGLRETIDFPFLRWGGQSIFE